MTDEYQFGYPRHCEKCNGISKFELRVAPYYKSGNNFRLMLIGQDPTISREPHRVKKVLRLDEPNKPLTRWLKELIGQNFESVTLYATNLVKCTFAQPPSKAYGGGLRLLQEYFANCKDYLSEELLNFKPTCALTLGEPAHRLFSTILENHESIPLEMEDAFTGRFIKVHFSGLDFDYSPCVHITTFRVAEVYGESVNIFKINMRAYLESAN